MIAAVAAHWRRPLRTGAGDVGEVGSRLGALAGLAFHLALLAFGTSAQAAARVDRLPPRLPSDPPVLLPVRPRADGPPPAGCAPPGGTWCEAVDGAATSRVLIADLFDTLDSTSRGWTATGLWHEVEFPTCPSGSAGGASTDPGGAWYFGVDESCRYLNGEEGLLESPTSSLVVTSATRMSFASRGDFECSLGPPCFDRAELLFNGDVVAEIDPLDLEPDEWLTFEVPSVDEGEAFFEPYLGSTLRVGFRFTADVVSSSFLGWLVDDVRVWDAGVGNPSCLFGLNGWPGGATCDQTVATRWAFNEGDFCQECAHTFYVLVECGREMHLPLLDMEGADIRVTDLLSGEPVELRCVNETARWEAGGPAPTPAVTRDCCADAAEEEWWAPALDATDDLGPGRVGWGLPDCATVDALDADGDGEVGCGELPGCGGALADVSPGEHQVVDCFVSPPSGACGLYRVDVISGGFAWDLFANCDGSATPRFPVFHDCTDAWAAFEPLPELALADLVVPHSCPELPVSFTLENIGCAEHPGDVLVRVTSDCIPADSVEEVVPGPIPAGAEIPVVVPLSVSCEDVRVEVVVDPDDAVLECTESGSAFSCSAEAGVDALSAVACDCAVALRADAGADGRACAGEEILLDGSGSEAAGCSDPRYRWLDEAGVELAPPSSEPMLSVMFDACPDATTYQLELACGDEPCTSRDAVRVGCIQPIADAGEDVTAAPGEHVVLDGAGSSVTSCAEVEYRWLDGAGAEVRGWSTDPLLDVGIVDCSGGGEYTLEVRCATGGECFDADAVRVEVDDSGVPAEVPGLRLERADGALELRWASALGADTYRVVRGPLGSWYDHRASSAEGRGACDTAGATSHVDPDDATDGLDHYYLVLGVGCGGTDGTAGFADDGSATPPERDSRGATADCP